MKRIKHFLGWLLGYCPYGDTCPPKHPFKKQEHGFFPHGGSGAGSGQIMMSQEDYNKMIGGGGC